MLKTIKRMVSILLSYLLFIFIVPMRSFASAPPETASQESNIIVSMGDSYSAGEGITPFFGGYSTIEDMEARGEAGLADFQDWLAHRSKYAWSGKLTLPDISDVMAEHRNENWFFVASSGAVIDDLYNSQWKSYAKDDDHGAIQSDYINSYRQFLAPQLNIFDELKEKNLYADYVTITIGGNDLGFSDIVTQCVISDDSAALQAMIDAAKERFHYGNGSETPIRDKLKEAYLDIITAAGEQAHLIVAGYPILFDSSGGSVFFDNNVILEITPAEASIVQEAAIWFDEELEAIVDECGKDSIHYVSVIEAFDGHAAYSQEPYINEVVFTQSEDLIDFYREPNTIRFPRTHYDPLEPITPLLNTIASAFSIHPNLLGSQAYADCVQEKIYEVEKSKNSNSQGQESPEEAGYEDSFQANAIQYHFELFSPNQELSVEREKQIQIICKLYYGNQLITNWEQPGIAIGNADLISYIACEPVEEGYCITLQGKSEGTATLTLSDNTSGASISVLVNVTADSSASYNYILGQIPCGYPDSFWDREVLTNFYNFNGLYVTGLEKDVEPQDGVYHLNFKVYNTRYMHGSVDIYNENREWINSVRIDKNANVRGVWDVAKKGFFVLCDFVELNGSYTSSLTSTETMVNIEVPEGGYFIISNNFYTSPAVYLYNGIDFAIYAANKTLDFTITSESIKDIQDKTIKQVLKSPEFLTVFQNTVTKNAAKMATDTSGNVLTVNLADSAGRMANEMIDILDEVDINFWDVTASVTDVAVDVFVSFLPPQISQALDFMFTSSEVTDFLGQLDNIAKSYGKPYIEIYTPDACSTVNVLEKSHGESDSPTEKRLTQADVCFKNGNSWQVKLNYNDNGLLTGYTQDSYSSEHECHYSYAYTYNSGGKLTQSQEILSGFPCSKYYYDDEGKMTGWEYWEFSWSDGKVYTCEYNASGQRIRDISTNGKDETLYFYDDLGRLVSVSSRWVYGDMSGTEKTTMTYDEYGNLTKKEILSDSGVGFPSMQTFIYNYDHFPFVHVTVYRGGELMYSCLEYNAMSADERVSFTIDNTAKFESEEGYLVKVKGEDCEWNFSYEQGKNLPVLDVSDSENQAGEANTSLRVIREASVGDYVTYGAYEQDNDLTNGQEPIEWLVLDREGDRVLLLSRYGLDAQPYNTVNMDVTWEKSSIRSWLNETFLRNAFSVEEQQFIMNTNVDNSKSQGYYAWSTSGGNGTQDKIFLLSYLEANKYLGVTDSARENIISQVLPTDYARARGAYSGVYPPDSDKTESAVIGWWWLRSPGFKQYVALCVNVGGSVSFYSEVGKTSGCIRPVFWISVE